MFLPTFLEKGLLMPFMEEETEVQGDTQDTGFPSPSQGQACAMIAI